MMLIFKSQSLTDQRMNYTTKQQSVTPRPAPGSSLASRAPNKAAGVKPGEVCKNLNLAICGSAFRKLERALNTSGALFKVV